MTDVHSSAMRDKGRSPLEVLESPLNGEEHDAGVDTLLLALRFAAEHDAATLELMRVKRRKVALRSLVMLPVCIAVFVGATLYLKWSGRGFQGIDALVVLGPLAIICLFLLAVIAVAGRWGSEAHVTRARHFQRNALSYAAFFAHIAAAQQK